MLSHFFTNQTLIEVLLYFVLNPGQETILSQLVHATDKALIQVQRTLKRLIETGIVLKTTHNRKTAYKVDETHIAYDDLRHLVLKAKIFSDTFKEDIATFRGKVDYGFIFGSVAKGTNTKESDIDIFLVGNLTYEDVGPFMFHLGSHLVQEVNVVIFLPSRFQNEIENKSSFVEAILHSPKIWLFGDKSEFEKIYR